MISESYKCDGQIELLDYLGQLEEETKKCLGCIYYKDFKCVRQSCHRTLLDEGWNPLWYNKVGHVFGKWPTCEIWKAVETICEGKGKIYVCEAEAKDKTFRWPNPTSSKIFDDVVIAWRYKGDKA